MRNLADIKYRMKGISETRQITGAMETISIAKMRKALNKYETNLQYFNRVRTTIGEIIAHSKDITHKYLTGAGGDRALLIVIASDKGLCGGYNCNVLNNAAEIMKNFKQVNIFTVGYMSREFFERRGIPIDAEYIHTTLNPTFADAKEIAENIISLFDLDMMDEVYIVYTAMENASAAKPAVIKLLPLSGEDFLPAEKKEETDEQKEYYKEILYDPSPEVVLNALVPQYLTGVIYGALVQSVAGEHSSRRLAMSNATKNADGILERLTLDYNRARQESVTNELSEIITVKAE